MNKASQKGTQLKCVALIAIASLSIALNRTIMELKCRLAVEVTWPKKGLNRTIVELEQDANWL
jgi:hypothetical protein